MFRQKNILIWLITAMAWLLGQNALGSNKVIIDSISIDPNTNEVIIAWNHSTTPNIPYYIVHFKNLFIGTSFQLDTVQATEELIYRGINPNYNPSETAVEYRIQNSDSTFSIFVKTMLLTHSYDSCDTEIVLNWSPYEQWEVETYEIIDMNSNMLIAKTNDTTFTIADLGSSINYSYYIRARGENGGSSASNSIQINTGRPDIPRGINIQSISNQNNNSIQVLATIDGNTVLNDYRLYRSESENFTNSILVSDTYVLTDDSLLFLDQNIEESIEYFYQIELSDVCGLSALSSSTANNIVLLTENNNYQVELSWNNPIYFNNNSQAYVVKRIVNTTTEQTIGGSSQSNYADNLESLLGMGLQNEICYFIEATEVNQNRPPIISNLACVKVTPDIYVPLIITPNGDGLNDVFTPQFTFLPAEYHLQIFNRSGNMIFESKDPTETWIANDFEQGTYAYKIVVRNDDFKLNKAGHVSLIK